MKNKLLKFKNWFQVKCVKTINLLKFDKFVSVLLSSISYFCLVLVVGFLIYDIFLIVLFFINKFSNLNTVTDIICNMSSNTSSNTSHSTNVGIDRNSGGVSWREAFIYGTGVLRLSFLRSGGTTGQRAIIVGSTIVSEAASKAIMNAINDPNYIREHIDNWKIIINGDNNDKVHIEVGNDSDMVEKLNKFVSGGSDNLGLSDFTNNMFKNIMETLKPILEPVQVDYSNVLLAEQIYGISILLFILSVLITGLLLAFMFNVIILVYSDKLLNLFTNKYIRWYISFNKKIIGIEICFLGGSILYFMYILSYGIHFIATHPIIIT